MTGALPRYTYTGYTLTGDPITLDTPVSASGYAGAIHLTTTSGTVNAWCLDVYDVLAGSGTYTFTPVSASNVPGVPSLTSAQIGQIGALIVNGNRLVSSPPEGQTANDIGTAIQLSIWSIEYGARPPASLTYSSANATVDSLVTTYVSDAMAGAGQWQPFTGYSALFYTDDSTLTSNQTLVAAVPEASTWAMMLAGFAGLGIAGYRTSRRGLAMADASKSRLKKGIAALVLSGALSAFALATPAAAFATSASGGASSSGGSTGGAGSAAGAAGSASAGSTGAGHGPSARLERYSECGRRGFFGANITDCAR